MQTKTVMKKATPIPMQLVSTASKSRTKHLLSTSKMKALMKNKSILSRELQEANSLPAKGVKSTKRFLVT